MRKQKDILWKGVLEQLFADFISFINPDLAQSIDIAMGFEFLNQELIQGSPLGEGRNELKIVDKLVRLHTHEGKQILLHLEVQEKYSKDFGQRMYAYFNRLYDKYKMPIIAYAIFTESNEIKRTNTYGINYMGTNLSYEFNTYKIALQDDIALMNHSNPFALIILIAKASLLKKGCKSRLERDEKLLAHKLKIVSLILEKKLSVFKEKVLMDFLFFYINSEISKTKVKFD